MVTLPKCLNCQQFNQDAYEQSDQFCARCKKALDKGLTQMPDRAKNTAKADQEANESKTDDENNGDQD